MFNRLYAIVACFLLSVPLIAQSYPSAEGRPRTLLWVGASFSSFNPDYGCPGSSPFTCFGTQVMGITPYADTTPFLLHRVGVEGQANFLLWHAPSGMKETSYLAGPTISAFRYENVSFGVKLLLGIGHFQPPSTVGGSPGNYFVLAPAGDFDYRVKSRVSLRIEYEYQRWPGFQGQLSGSGHGGLTPNGLSAGVSYALR